MKKLLLITVLLIFTSVVIAQDSIPSKWKKAFQTGLNINQAAFSDNWKGGGTNSIALGTFFNAKANYESTNLSFSNGVELQYGIQKNKDQDSRKNADKIYLDSKLGYKFNAKWNLFASINLQSQFDDGFAYAKDANGAETRTLISRYASPAYLTSSVGLEYKPVNYFWIRFGTGTLRQTFVMDRTIINYVPKNYGVEPDKQILNEIAFQLVADYDKNIAKNLNIKARYTLFANYKDLKAIDNKIDLVLTAKVTKFINVNITATALYDQDMDFKTQYTQTFALGIMYNFSQF